MDGAWEVVNENTRLAPGAHGPGEPRTANAPPVKP